MLLKNLEGIRFLASVSIVLYHYVPYYTDGYVSRFYIAVDAFFVISGIVIGSGYARNISTGKEYLGFVQNRIARIYPLHLATLTFYVAIGFLLWNGLIRVVDPRKYDASQILPNLLLVHAWQPHGMLSFNYVSWSISAEFFVYLCFPLLALLARARPAVALLGMATLLVATVTISEGWMHSSLLKLGPNLGILRALPSFTFGVLLAARRQDLVALLPLVVAPRLLYACVGTLVFMVLVGAGDYWLLAGVYLFIASAYACDLHGVLTMAGSDVLSSRGPLTYSIYMLHPVVATALLAVILPRILGSGPLAGLVSIAVALAATYFFAVLSLRYFEDPLRKALRARSSDHRALRPAGEQT
jgi:peptidoglycan/LPS O-acetylase OafA/YrhL